jgi:replicative DNA helicase
MSLDITTLRLLKTREKYEELIGAVPEGSLEPSTRVILADFGRWFREHPDVKAIDFGTFPHWFKTVHPNVKPEQHAVYTSLFTKVQVDVEPGLELGIRKRWIGAATAAEVTKILESYYQGEEVDLLSVTTIMDKYDERVKRELKNPQVLDPIEDMLKKEEESFGLKFRQDALNAAIKPLVDGDLVLLAMRPDKGKTTWCSDQVTFMAPQIDQLYPGQGHCILWLNNEGPGTRIVMRTFQSALGCTTEELIALSNTPSKTHGSMVREKYAAAVGGRMGVLRIMDVHGWWHHEIEELYKKYKPKLVIADMIDNIRFGGEVLNNGQRTDQLLEGMYQWQRMMGVKYGFATIANSQLSADADGVQFPTLPQLKDSKTGKQGAADVIITGGAVNDPQLSSSRYLGTTKNKKLPTRARPLCVEMLLDVDRGRYNEAPR